MIALLTAVAFSLSPLQADTFLSRYLSSHPWNAVTSGPMIAVETRSSRYLGRGEQPPAYHPMKAGGVTAIAPTEMVLVDASMKEPVDYYDGLPREQKVLYLASTLTESQWQTAATSGIGLGDLNRDQQAVFRSILPSRFTYTVEKLGEHGSFPGNSNEITLTPQQEEGVKLHFFKEITLGVRFAGNGGFSCVSPEMTDTMKPGQEIIFRKKDVVEDETSMFGIKIRKVLPNSLKPSHLSYSSAALDGRLKLPKELTVDDLCKAASTTTGLHLIADVRLGKNLVRTAGDSARVGDVLQALCLSLTSTFRKVGDVYVLTSDLEGVGAKRMKIALWRWDLEQQTRNRSEDWKEAMRQNRGIRKVAIDSANRFQPNEAMTKFMAGDSEQGDKTMRARDLPQIWQDLLTKGHFNFADNLTVRTDVAEPWEQVFWNFALPDGRNLHWEAELGDLNEFTKAERARKDTSSKSVIKPIPLSPTTAPALVYQTQDPAVAVALPGLAKAHGCHELWLQTWKAECLGNALQSAKSAGLPLRLVVEPWRIPPGASSNDPDRTIMGHPFPEAVALQAQTTWWNDARPSWGIPPLPAAQMMGPNDPLREPLWRSLHKLASTPGLEGTVLLETEPPGYEPKVSNTYYGPFEMTTMLNLGYTTDQRRRFLLQYSVDPIDLADGRLDVGKLDLRLPTFDSVDSSSAEGNLVKWIGSLAEENLKEIKEFSSGIPGSVIFQSRRNVRDLPRLTGYRLTAWQAPADLPTTDGSPHDDWTTPANDYWLWKFGYPIEPKVGSRIYDGLKYHFEKSAGKIAFDFSSVPANQLAKMLDQWFASRPE